MTTEEKMYKKFWDEELKKDMRLSYNSRAFIAMKYLDKGDRILDVGCGRGEIGKVAKDKFREIHGVDISDLSLKIAEENGVIVKKVNLNQENLPYPDSFFDAVVCLDVFEHILDHLHLLSEFSRVLKPNGSLILTVPNFRKIKNIFYLLFKGEFPRTSYDLELWDSGHLHYFTFKDIKMLLEKYKFKIVKRGYILSEEKYQSLKKFLERLLPQNLFSEFIAAGILVKAINKK